MKKLLIISFAMVLSLSVAPVYAQDDSVQTTNQNQQQDSGDGEATPGSTGTTQENREARLQNYKERFAETVSAAEQQRLQAACKKAQTVVGRLNKNTAQVKKIRENAYGSISEKLTNLVTKLEAAGVDATDLANAVTTMENEAQIFLATMSEYETILTDLSELDCENDPEAFKAALSVAKQQRVTLISSSQGLRQYFNDSIKPILQQLRQQLVNDTEGES